MKAKEYNNKFKIMMEVSGVDIAIYETFKNMFLEVKEIQKKRKAKSDTAIIAIFNEVNIKANSFIRMANKDTDAGLIKDAFKKFVSIKSPDFANMIGW